MDRIYPTRQWYKELVVYQIWPRSFCDGNADGIGDIKGVISKIDYIKQLGANAIWFSPLYKSPQKDYGYDISDYRDIAPEYGTLEEFKQLLALAHEKGLKIIMDLVVNHTSDQHQWFLESRKSKDNPYHDYYFWRAGKKGGKKPPNNWLSTFPGPAWQYDEHLNEYYLHLFAVEQPDLNMDNPRVREEVKNIMRFWLDMGVDGFREDVITFISKKEGLPNGFPLPAARGIEQYVNGPHIHEYLGEFRKEVLDRYTCMTVGEAPMMTPKVALRYIEEGENQQLNMMFHFQHMEADCLFISWIRRPFNLRKLKKVYDNWQTKLYGKAWNALYLENHDQPRIISRYGDECYRAESGKLLATMYLCQSGTPFIYQGQEIGMTNIRLPELDMYVDISTINTYKLFRKLHFKHETIMKIAKEASRDNARTPMQWSAGKNAGFTQADKAWFHINPNYTEVNVEAQLEDPDSLLNYYRKLLALRKENPVFVYGDFKMHYRRSKKLFVYERNFEGEKLLVICVFSDEPVRFRTTGGLKLAGAELLLSNYTVDNPGEDDFLTKPYETRVYLFR
ncbi:MAG: Oligo-1,6-glucosidase [Firmicutes bacterium ADurb.Bin262]|nr:MAG: Oligo-1,6-glucosidase [Firmicutes bacterium ADurb.Bin262]